MIILPPEDKKPSLILKWIFRVLMFVVVMGALIIFALNVLSGTGEAHKRGLEQAFSDIFKTPVTIGTLTAFNIFPLFNLEMENVRGPYGTAGGEVRAERVVLVFRFFDLLFGRDLIKDLQIQNLTVTPDIIGAYGLRIEKAEIVPAKKQGEQSAFKVSGTYGGLPVSATLGLEMVGGVQPVYRIVNDLPTQINLGRLGVSGRFVQNGKGEPSVRKAEFLADGKSVATGTITLLTSQSSLGVQVDFVTPHSEGSLITGHDPKTQVWNFEKLDLSDVVSNAPVWALISNALEEIAPAATTMSEEDSNTSISISIKSMTGALSGENLRGEFIAAPDKIIGWWDGVITTSASKANGVPPSGAVQCGLLSLSPKGTAWSTDKGLVLIDPASILVKLMVESATGKIDWSIDRVASGAPTVFDVDMKPFSALKKDLNIPPAHPCLAHIEKV